MILNTRHVAIAVLVALAGIPAATLAQEATVIQYPSGVSEPTEALLPPGSFAEIPWTVWINAEGLRPRAAIEPDSKPLSRRFTFLQPVQVACRYPDNKDDSPGHAFLLVETANRDSREVRKILGWVDDRSVIQFTTPEILCRGGKTKTQFHCKGMAVLRQEALEQLGAGAGKLSRPVENGRKDSPWQAPLRLAPRERMPDDPRDFDKRPFSLFSFYFIFGRAKGYVLVGTAEKFDPDRPQDVVYGWLPECYHTEWDSRIGYEWNSESYRAAAEAGQGGARYERAFVFGSADTAQAFNRDASPWTDTVNSPPGAIFEERLPFAPG